MLFLWLSVLVVSVRCAPYGGLVNTGHSTQYRNDDGYGNYEFGYNENHSSGGSFRKEKGGPGYQVGSYGLHDADGRLRIIHYIADANGFRVTSMTTNEPGVDHSQPSASTSINSASVPVAANVPSPIVHAQPPLHSNSVYNNDADLLLSKASNSMPFNQYIPASEFYESPSWNRFYDPMYYLYPSPLPHNWKRA